LIVYLINHDANSVSRIVVGMITRTTGLLPVSLTSPET